MNYVMILDINQLHWWISHSFYPINYLISVSEGKGTDL